MWAGKGNDQRKKKEYHWEEGPPFHKHSPGRRDQSKQSGLRKIVLGNRVEPVIETWGTPVSKEKGVNLLNLFLRDVRGRVNHRVRCKENIP